MRRFISLTVLFAFMTSPVSALVDTGVLMRYYIDEAASGTAPSDALDSVADPANLGLVYDGNMAYDEDAANKRHLESDAVTGDQRGEFSIDDASDKIRDLDGNEQKWTWEVKVAVDAGTSSNGRIFVFQRDDVGDNPDLGFTATDQDFRFYWEEAIMRTWSITDANTTVWTAVVDTTQGTANDRIIIYKNGADFSGSTSKIADPAQNDTLTLNASAAIFIFNRRGSVGDFDRSFNGRLFYGAAYTSAFSAQDVSDNFDILDPNDDTPSVVGGSEGFGRRQINIMFSH